MFNKLKENSLQYTVIVFYLWSLCDYFSNTLCIECGQSPFSHYMLEKIIREGDITVIRLSFPTILDEEHPNTEYEYEEAKEVLNEHLQLSLNCDNSLIKPYRFGDRPKDLIAPLYLSFVYRGEYRTDFYFYYIDNQITYKEVESDTKLSQDKGVPQI